MPTEDTPGVLAPPPLIFATALALGWLLQRLVPQPLLPGVVAPWVGGVLVVAALGIAGAAVWEMRRARTAVDPYSPSTALVRSGPFARSRNPIYVALILLSLGVAALVNALWSALLLLPAVAVLRRFVIAREEAYLERRFGEEYRTYRDATPRWLF
jgi:protein-S-isoprenylcysteine O-methyltransferase Ste14